MTPPPSAPAEAPGASPRPFLSPPPWISLACLALAGVVVLGPLTASWTYLSNYAFGWWVPLLAAILFAERWERRPVPAPSRGARFWDFLVGWSLLFLGVRMALEVSLVARPLVLLAALLYVAALFHWLTLYGGAPWRRHFAFPVLFLLLAVPWPLQIENPVVQGLAPFNAWLVAHALVDCGILARATGQVIELPNCTLGVEEACSGLRSIQAALMIAFLLGELFRLPWPRRLGLVAAALGLALLGNFLRTFFLALVASRQGPDAVGAWHDSAGTFILLFTSFCTFLIAWGPARRGLPPAAVLEAVTIPPSPGAARARHWAVAVLAAALLAEGVTRGWYDWRALSSATHPMWTLQAPTDPGSEEVPIERESRDMLKYDAGKQLKWPDARGWSWVAYWFRYHHKPWAVSAFTNHNPAKCLPSVGYHREGVYPVFTTLVHGAPLETHPKEFSWQGHSFYVFWVVYAGRDNFPLAEAVDSFNVGPWAKARFILGNIWKGRRGSGADTESLEIVLDGPASYAEARAAYEAKLPEILVPDEAPQP